MILGTLWVPPSDRSPFQGSPSRGTLLPMVSPWAMMAALLRASRASFEAGLQEHRSTCDPQVGFA